MPQNIVKIFKNQPNFGYISVKIGDWVVIKPNLVKQHKETDPNEWESIITSPDLIKQVCLYVCKKLKGKGKSILYRSMYKTRQSDV